MSGGLLHTDDLDGDPERFRWIEYHLRILVPADTLKGSGLDFDTLYEHARTVDEGSVSQAGAGGRCPTCGLVTIVMDGPQGVFPWGQNHYGQQAVYCPHCDGGEDVG